MLASHLRVTRAHLRITRHLIHPLRPMRRTSGSCHFAGVHFGVVSTNIPFISGLELALTCSGLITRSRSLKITFGYLPDFVPSVAFSCSCRSFESFSALTFPRACAVDVIVSKLVRMFEIFSDLRRTSAFVE